MNVLAHLRARFREPLRGLISQHLAADGAAAVLEDALTKILPTPSKNARFGDYQVNCVTDLAQRMGQAPADLAAAICSAVELDDCCQPPEIANGRLINLRLRNDWIADQLRSVLTDPRLGAAPVAAPRTFVLDFSSPNVAKPMHVGHIRSTVIGDALTRTLRFLGHRVITDNHLGDWGTQFGMIIYGYKHLVDADAYRERPVAELSRLYRLVNTLIGYHKALGQLPAAEAAVQLAQQRAAEAEQAVEASDDKKTRKRLKQAAKKLKDDQEHLGQIQRVVSAVRHQPELLAAAEAHPQVESAVLGETSALHAGDPENLRLWHEFLPNCRDEISKVYQRLHIQFDYSHGESFYHEMLATVVDEFGAQGLARESDGAMCVFLDGIESPMIIRKQDGAYLYSTTDLATIRYRMDTWNPDAILYVVDHRQEDHFKKLFAAARLWGYGDVELQHIKFGTVCGSDGKPFKTREGAAGLEELLDEAVANALRVVSENDEAKQELSDARRAEIADVVGHAAVKYADLSHNRTSDYIFDPQKMVRLEGNTATYMQYSFARTQAIFRRADVDQQQLLEHAPQILLDDPAERELALGLLRFPEALADTVSDYRPNQLTSYIFDSVAVPFSKFYERCPVVAAENPQLRDSRLALCALTGRVIRKTLMLLGIDVVEKM